MVLDEKPIHFVCLIMKTRVLNLLLEAVIYDFFLLCDIFQLTPIWKLPLYIYKVKLASLMQMSTYSYSAYNGSWKDP